MTQTIPTSSLVAEDMALVPNRARVSMEAIRHNASQISSLLDEQTALMAVVKADAYSHGMIEAASAAIAGGATWLGVAHPASALALTDAGFDVPILTWLFEPHTAQQTLPRVVEAGIDVAVGSLDMLELVIEAGRRVDRRARVHLKIDTGMGRGGVLPSELTALATLLRLSDHAHLVGAMSHLHSADVLGSPSIDAQAEIFAAACDAMSEELGPIPLRHLANTAATLSRPDLHLDMVRVGIGMYGLPPVPTDLDLRPAMTLSSRLAMVKHVPAGSHTGYGALHEFDSDTNLGLVPIGYADGLHRTTSGRGRVLVRTDGGPQSAQQVGRLSMDQLVVDLGADTEARPGDEVIIFGDPSAIEGAPTAEEWATAADTISYEILTCVCSRVARVTLPLEADEEPAEAEERAAAETPEPAPEAAAVPADAASAEAQGHETQVQAAAETGSDWQVVPQVHTLSLQTYSAEETRRVAQQLAVDARAGDLIVLDGPLGAGKTTFTQGFATQLNVRGAISSPTFVISRVHPALDGGPDLVHVDAYRLEDDWAIEDLDLDSDLEESIMLVEWGRDRVEHLASSYVTVELIRPSSAANEDPDDLDEPRTIRLTFVGARYAEADLEALAGRLSDAGLIVHSEDGA